MAQVKVHVEFLNGAGHIEINIVPLDNSSTTLEHSGDANYNLDAGSYSITLDGVSPSGGSTEVTVFVDGQSAASLSISGGVFSEHCEISI